jgi:multidrug efflux pump subunit AcrA (membrane-fusion protein)
MKLFLLFLLVLVVGAGLFYWRGQGATASIRTTIAPSEVRSATGPLLGEGTVLASHSFPLALYRHGPIKHLYVDDGQHVRKGDLLLKFYDYTFLMAPTAGIITQYSTMARAGNPGAEPEFFFTEATPFRLRLAATSTSAALAVGQRVQAQSTQHPAQVVTGVLSAIESDSAALLITLRLLTVGHEPLPAQAQIQLHALPETLERLKK